MAASLALARATETNWTDSKALGRYPYNFASAMITVLPGWEEGGWNHECHGEALTSTVHLKNKPRYIEEF